MNFIIAIISIALSLGATWLYSPPSWRTGQRAAVNFIATAAAGLHTLFILSNLAFHRPPNLFTRLRIPINAPVDHIKTLLLREARFNSMGVAAPLDIPKDVDMLLTRLGAHGGRDAYVRFGQRALQTCPFCSSTTDYTILVLSSILLDYLRTATLLLLLTTNINGRQRWRTNVLGMLTCAFLAEVYAFTSASTTPLQRDAVTAFMWHDNLFLARNILFIVLPIFIQKLPALHPPPPASAALAPTLERLERTLPRVHLFRYFHQAILRRPYTRERIVDFWANNAAEGASARSDPNVQTTASKLGFGFATPEGPGDSGGPESVLRMSARTAVRSLKPLFMPPPN